MGSPTEVCFENLADVHSRRHAKRIQHDLNRRSIREIGHVFVGENARDDALVAVTAGHFVADRELALHRNINLHELDHARRQLVTAAEFVDPLFMDLSQDIDLTRGHLFDLLNGIVRIGSVLELEFQKLSQREVLDDFAGHLGAFPHDLSSGAVMNQFVRGNLAFEQPDKPLVTLVGEYSNFVPQILFQPRDFHVFDLLRAFVLFCAFA